MRRRISNTTIRWESFGYTVEVTYYEEDGTFSMASRNGLTYEEAEEFARRFKDFDRTRNELIESRPS